MAFDSLLKVHLFAYNTLEILQVETGRRVSPKRLGRGRRGKETKTILQTTIEERSSRLFSGLIVCSRRAKRSGQGG